MPTSDAERHAANVEVAPGVLCVGLQGSAEHQIGPEALRRDLRGTEQAYAAGESRIHAIARASISFASPRLQR